MNLLCSRGFRASRSCRWASPEDPLVNHLVLAPCRPDISWPGGEDPAFESEAKLLALSGHDVRRPVRETARRWPLWGDGSPSVPAGWPTAITGGYATSTRLPTREHAASRTSTFATHWGSCSCSRLFRASQARRSDALSESRMP
jgi:hypothetical protein